MNKNRFRNSYCAKVKKTFFSSGFNGEQTHTFGYDGTNIMPSNKVYLIEECNDWVNAYSDDVCIQRMPKELFFQFFEPVSIQRGQHIDACEPYGDKKRIIERG